MGYMNNDGLLYFWNRLKTIFIRKVNNQTPDANGNVTIDIPAPATEAPLMDESTAAVGNSAKYAREDHKHPVDTSRAASSHTHGNITNAGALQSSDVTIANGDKIVVTDSSNSNKVARTSAAFDGSTETKALSKKGTWVDIPQKATANPSMDGTAAVGSSAKFAKEDHVHPTDSSRAPINSPSFTGTPTAPNPDDDAYSTELVTAAWVRTFYARMGTGATSFKGVINSFSAITSDLHYIEKGWFWVVGTAGTYAGQDCEQGDFIYALDSYIFGTITISGTAYPYGDADMDGEVTAADAAAITRYLEGLITFNSNQMLLADADGDGSVTANDVEVIMQALTGINMHQAASIPNSAFAIVQTNIIPMTNSEIDTIIASS